MQVSVAVATDHGRHSYGAAGRLRKVHPSSTCVPHQLLLLPGLDTPEDYSPVINRVLACLKEPVNLTEGTVQVSASIGITLYPQAKASAEQLIHQADQAMYQAKRKGRNQYQVFVKNENPESR